MKRITTLISALLVLFGLMLTSSRVAAAASITVLNPSFESPFVTGAGGLYQTGTPDNWTASGFTSQYIERQDNGGFTGQPGISGANNQYIANDGAGTLTQDLLVTFMPYTTYTVDMAGGHRNGFAGSYTEFGLQSTTNPGVDLTGAVIGYINENALPASTFDYASALVVNGGVFTFTTGSSVPAGNLLAFIRTSDTGTRLHADSFSVTSLFDPPPAPEPSSFILISLGALGLVRQARRRHRQAAIEETVGA